MIAASVIISYYKNTPALELILLALKNQSAAGSFEVIVSEDDDAPQTVNFLNNIQNQLPFSIKHLTQPDEGFLKCKALNKAVQAATAPLLIFIDGDCIPHRHFVKEYIRAARPGRVLYGRRVMLSENVSQQLLQQKKISILHFANLIRYRCSRIEEAIYCRWIPQQWLQKKSGRLLGCNMGIQKADLISINGFDEDYTAPCGGEDSDIEWRLEKAVQPEFYSMKFKAIQYHLWHKERETRALELQNLQLMKDKIKAAVAFCKNGIQKL
jgi:cellulose synthase/poly-beta-1,6-N-acetylglucosamine synthase-like glycosyltransferase